MADRNKKPLEYMLLPFGKEKDHSIFHWRLASTRSRGEIMTIRTGNGQYNLAARGILAMLSPQLLEKITMPTFQVGDTPSRWIEIWSNELIVGDHQYGPYGYAYDGHSVLDLRFTNEELEKIRVGLREQLAL